MADKPFNVDEDACRRFQSALWDRQSERFEDFVPSKDDPNYLATLEELVYIDLEFQWKRQAKTLESSPHTQVVPRVEDDLARFPRLQDPAIVRRLLEQEYRVGRPCVLWRVWPAAGPIGREALGELAAPARRSR